MVESEIKVGGTGALSSVTDKKDHGFHLIQWIKVPCILQKEKKVFGIKEPIASGNVPPCAPEVLYGDIEEGSNWWRVLG